MKKIIDKIATVDEQVWEQLIGEPEKAIPAKAQPAAVGAIINWASKEVKAPIILIGQEVHIWNGKNYERGAVYDVIDATLRVLKLPVALAIDSDFIRNVEKALSVASDRYAMGLDMSPKGINFQDGVLYMTQTSVEFVKGHDHTKVFTYCLPFNYMGERKKSKVWRKFIEQIVPDRELRRYILASFANSIACDPMRAQRMLLLMGVGASGKSTLIDAVVATIGSQNACRVDDLRNLTKDDSRYRIDLAKNILCICGDASGNIGNKDVLKQIISKEEISGRRLYKEIEYFYPRASLLVASNEIGFTHALGDSGISRRIDIIQFNNPVAEKDRDPFIGEKLAAPLEQREMILDMVDCMIEMQNTHGKMVRPDALAQALTDLMYDGDSFLAFMGWCGIEADGEGPEDTNTEWLHQSALRDAYNRFSGEYGNAPLGMKGLKGKCRVQGAAMRSASGRSHNFKFKVVDNELFTKNFFLTAIS
jgi:phage/plasmid-associated DNA primase